MAERKLLSLVLDRCVSLDRDDLYANDISYYPESYQTFRRTIENAFFKSELLLKCKMEFERLVTIEILKPKQTTEISDNDLNLNMIFTGAIKSGRSSIINMILNTKVMPINVLGSSCCVKISHPKSSTKQISVGTHDWDGWELDKSSDIEIEDLPKKIEEMQKNILRHSFGKGNKSSRRLHVQLPHWFLKNICIYKCSPIDGMYSFDEPFEIIEKTKNTILMHVIDASNGLMEWDRTFLAKIQYKLPHLPIFFIINHVDIQYEILMRDRCLQFGTLSDKPKSEYYESESDQTSNDETMSDRFQYTEQGFIKQQLHLIDNSKKQITKLGFALEKGLTIYYTSLSVKEFYKSMKENENEKDSHFHMDLVKDFFKKLKDYLDAWMEKMLITSSLQLKCQINGVVDAILCHIIYPSTLSQDITSDIYMQNIKKAEKSISDTFNTVTANLEKSTLKIVKDRLKLYEDTILKKIPTLSTEDPAEIIHIIKPVLIKNCEEILIGQQYDFNLNNKIHSILTKEIEELEISFTKICKAKKIVDFTKYIFNLFRVLKKTFNYPLIINLPEEIFYGNTKWYKDILRVASRRIRGTSVKPRDVVQEMINDMTSLPLIKTALVALENIQKDIQFFTRKYQETYKTARNWSTERTEVFKRLVMIDFIIQVTEKSFQQSHLKLCNILLHRLSSFYGEFYQRNEDDKFIHQKINIQSMTSLSNAVNCLCFKRILRSKDYILTFKSTNLLEDGMCLISYARMHFDLYTAILNETKWTPNNVCRIMSNLICAIKCLLPYHQYIQIDLLPENLLLHLDSTNVYSCYLFLYSPNNTSLKYNIRCDYHRKVTKICHALTFQLGMVLSWIITNNMEICSDTYDKSLSSDLEVSVIQNIKNNMLKDLQSFPFYELCRSFLFHSTQYDNMDNVSREFIKYQNGLECFNDFE